MYGVLVAYLTIAGNILDGDALDIDKDAFMKARAIVDNRNFRGTALDPRMERHMLLTHRHHRSIKSVGGLEVITGQGEVAEHLLVVGYIRLVPLNLDIAEILLVGETLAGVLVVLKAHVGHGIHAVLAEGDILNGKCGT